ncbi:MAG: DUF5115 domain-containing protein [Bacteroidaceae bacterium]|nr:DUF5115 domain-containing protein [Bacteroidaceae bacterium]
MKRHLLTLIVALTALCQASAQTTFQWGTATWNFEDGTVFQSIDDLKQAGITLTYPNPSNFTLTFFNAIPVSYDLYVDDATEPIKDSASGHGSTTVSFTGKHADQYVEGHRYRIVTTGAALVQVVPVDLATYSTDTLSTDNTSYSISFEIKGPELVKTIDVESSMSLSITSQDYDLTYSLIDTKEVCSLLGISSISEAAVWGLNVNGSYNPYFRDPFDGWRDADGEYTVWGGNAFSQLGHNAYPAVYCIKLNETADTVSYFFYDYWREYDPNENDSIGGGTIVQQAPRRAPDTHYNRIVWDWDNGDGTTTKYTRNYRVDEGQDYKASFAIIANQKMVRVNATMHFLSQEAYAEWLEQQAEPQEETGYYLVSELNTWSTTDQTYAFQKQDDGKTWTITIPGDKAIYFKIAPASAYADQANFWNLLLCAPQDGCTDLSGSMVVNGGAWRLNVPNAKEYTISIVPSEMAYAITVTENEKPYVPQPPFYLVGTPTGWQYDAKYVFQAQDNGTYTITFAPVYDQDSNKCWFKIATADAIGADGTINWAMMLCAPADGDNATTGTMLLGDGLGSWAFEQKEGIESYTVTINPTTMAYEIKENMSSHVDEVLTDYTQKPAYNLKGQRVNKPRRGLNVVWGKKGYKTVFVGK